LVPHHKHSYSNAHNLFGGYQNIPKIIGRETRDLLPIGLIFSPVSSLA
jgi:hypothetical protein